MRLQCRRVVGQPLSVDRELNIFCGVDPLERPGERHVAVALMMPVGFAIRRDVHELGVDSVGEQVQHTVREPVAVVE
jgi:hypothetical protein